MKSITSVFCTCHQTVDPRWKWQYFLSKGFSFLSGSPCANGCVMYVRAARSDVLCPAWISNQTMDLLLQPERTPSIQKAFISLLGLILHPRRDEREANEYRGGNVNLQGAACATPSSTHCSNTRIHIIWIESWMHQRLHTYTLHGTRACMLVR